MIHLAPHPATGDVVQRAMEEIEILFEEGVEGIIIENYHGSTDDVIKTLQAVEAQFIKQDRPLIGINLLPNEYKQAFNLAKEYDIDFIQLDYVAGIYDNKTQLDGELYMELKNTIVLGGVWPKYYHPVKESNLQFDLELAKSRCEAIVVTGQGTGMETPLDKIKQFKSYLGEHPLIVGAGVDLNNIKEQLAHADGCIVGSAFKKGHTTQKIDRLIVREFVNKRNELL